MDVYVATPKGQRHAMPTATGHGCRLAGHGVGVSERGFENTVLKIPVHGRIPT